MSVSIYQRTSANPVSADERVQAGQQSRSLPQEYRYDTKRCILYSFEQSYVTPSADVMLSECFRSRRANNSFSLPYQWNANSVRHSRWLYTPTNITKQQWPRRTRKPAVSRNKHSFSFSIPSRYFGRKFLRAQKKSLMVRDLVLLHKINGPVIAKVRLSDLKVFPSQD